MEEFEAGMDAVEGAVSVQEMRRTMALEVYEVAKRCDIMVGSVSTMWPICAMSSFLDACTRLEAARLLLMEAREWKRKGHPVMRLRIDELFPDCHIPSAGPI